jgi:hypothetical protein
MCRKTVIIAAHINSGTAIPANIARDIAPIRLPALVNVAFITVTSLF